LIQDPFHSDRWDYYYSVTIGDEKINENKLSIFFNEKNLVDSWVIEEIKDFN
jgi:outer membrane protein assembly factor BamE (lipoprotein component of BamABCDE complex)